MMKTAEGIPFYKFNKSTGMELNDGYSLCRGRTIKDWLEHAYETSFNVDNLLQTGCYRLMGYCFLLQGHLTRYIYKDVDDRIYEAYAPSVKSLRKARYLSRDVKVAKAPKGF